MKEYVIISSAKLNLCFKSARVFLPTAHDPGVSKDLIPLKYVS